MATKFVIARRSTTLSLGRSLAFIAATNAVCWTSANSLIVVTHDLDFGALLANRKTRQPGVIQIRTQDVLPAGIGDIVLRALPASRSQLEDGALVAVDLNRYRVRVVPI